MTRTLRRIGALLVPAFVLASGSAHVGSPNAFFAGPAGPWNVRVVVRAPAVIPGQADVTVHVPADQAGEVRRVIVRPVYWRTGATGSPKGDDAVRLAAADPTWVGKLWLMTAGAYSVYVTVEGTRGTGSAVVPVAATPTARLALGGALRAVLVVFAVVLVAGLLTVLYAAAGESLAMPGETVSPAARRRARRAVAVGIPITVIALAGGWRWWNAEARAYERTLYRPLAVRATTHEQPGGWTLRIAVTDSFWVAGAMSPVLPDHGKLMHLFAVREPALDVFAHLHPVMPDSNTFETALPALPPGQYRLFGDIVHESGFERTIVSRVVVPATPLAVESAHDQDDTWAVVEPTPAGGVARPLPDVTMEWLGDQTPKAGAETEIRVRLRRADGTAVALEPYIGMTGHAVVMREDGSVFVHLHPMGTVTMAAQDAFALRDHGDTTSAGRLRLADAPAPHVMAANTDGQLSFPYVFPSAGRYRIWVQAKIAGRVHTAAFAVTVE